jgi:hypothetical protein
MPDLPDPPTSRPSPFERELERRRRQGRLTGILLVGALLAVAGVSLFAWTRGPVDSPDSRAPVSVLAVDRNITAQAQAAATSLATGGNPPPPVAPAGCEVQGAAQEFSSRETAVRVQNTLSHQMASATAIGHALAKVKDGGVYSVSIVAVCR